MRKIKTIYEQSECRQISISYESKPCINITHNGFVRVFRTGEIGYGLKRVNKLLFRIQSRFHLSEISTKHYYWGLE